MHAVKSTFYWPRAFLFKLSGFVRFFTKPGSRVIVPAVMIALAILFRSDWHVLMIVRLQRSDPGYRAEPAALDIMLAVVTASFIVAYVLASKLLAVILGAVPTGAAPLKPTRDLREQKKAAEKKFKMDDPVPVRIVVPPLPR